MKVKPQSSQGKGSSQVVKPWQEHWQREQHKQSVMVRDGLLRGGLTKNLCGLRQMDGRWLMARGTPATCAAWLSCSAWCFPATTSAESRVGYWITWA